MDSPTQVRSVGPHGFADHVLGPDDADLELIGYGDYECPYTRRVQWTLVTPLLASASVRIRFVFRHFAIERRHPLARGAAEAAEIASAHDRFWQMHTRLFSRPMRLRPDDLVDHGRHIGVDERTMTDDAERRSAHRAVTAHVNAGLVDNVRGTPWFVMDGRTVSSGTLEYLLTQIAP